MSVLGDAGSPPFASIGPDLPFPQLWSHPDLAADACATALSTGHATFDARLQEGETYRVELVADSTTRPPRLLAFCRRENRGSAFLRPGALTQLRALVRASAVTLWRAGPDGRILDAEGWDELGEDPGRAYSGDSWLEALHPDDRDRTAENWRKAQETGVLQPVEYRVRRAGGGYRWVVARATAIRDAAGRLTEWIGTLTDIDERKRAELALKDSEELLRLAIGATRLGIWSLDLATLSTNWSAESREIAGIALHEVVTDELFWSMLHEEDTPVVLDQFRAVVERSDTTPWSLTYRIRRVDDRAERWVLEHARVLVDERGAPQRVVGTMEDITERKAAELARTADEERWRLALAAGRMVGWERDLDTGHTQRTENSLDLLGVGPGHATDFYDRVHPEDRAWLIAAMDPTAPRERPFQFRYLHPDGRMLWLESRSMLIVKDGRPRSIVGVTADITEAKLAAERLEAAASLDHLTGLLNRARFWTKVDGAIAEAAGAPVALILVDLDHFKEVNDTLGHTAGDRLLKETAGRIRAAAGPEAAVARLGGDEFAVLLTGLDGYLPRAETIRAALRTPVEIGRRRLSPSGCLGMAICPQDAADADGLFKAADLALYEAKSRGSGRIGVYTPQLAERVEERAEMSARLLAALEQGECVPFYQPKVSLADGRVLGFEALVRWIHPEKGVLGPAAFAPVLEEPAVASVLDAVMAGKVLHDLASWKASGVPVGTIALNLSPQAFREDGMAHRLIGLVSAHGLDPADISIEVTETVFLDGNKDLPRLLDGLSSAGIKLSLDDFGTGYASLTHLKAFPVDEIKIDRSFVRDLNTDPGDAAIVSAVIGLAEAFGVDVVAEGVETAEQIETLRAMGCGIAQGYAYARPMPFRDVPGYLLSAKAHRMGQGKAAVPEDRRPELHKLR